MNLLPFVLLACSLAQQGVGPALPPPPPPKPGDLTLPLDSATISTLFERDLDLLGVRFPIDVLRRVPGLELQRISATESAVGARGFIDVSSTSQGILGFLDGRAMNNEFFGNVFWDMLSLTLDDLQQVDILRGPGSFLYGSSALHGLVNFKTRSPLDYEADVIRFHGAAGPEGSNVESLLFVRRVGDSAVKVKVAHDDIDSFEADEENTRDKSSLEARFEHRFGSPDRRVDVAVGGSGQKFNTLIPPFSGLPAVTYRNSSRETFARGALQWEGLQVRASATRFEADAVPDAWYAPFTLISDTADIDLVYSLNGVTVGGGYRYTRFETDDADVADGAHHTHLGWAVLEDELKLGNWTVTGGVRVDDHSVAGATPSPRLAIVWTPDPLEPAAPGTPAENRDHTSHSFRATYGTGFRNPSLRELWFGMLIRDPFGNPVGTLVGNRDLEPEMMRSFELGYGGRPLASLQIEVALYYNLIDRLISYESTSSGAFQPDNNGKDEAWGGEIQVLIQITEGLSGFANYGYSIRRDRDTGKRNPAAPKNKSGIGFKYSQGTGLGGSLWTTYFDETEIIDPGTGLSIGGTDSYALLNAELEYRLDWGRVFVQAFNLLDHDHQEHPYGDSLGLLFMGGLDVAW